MNRKIDNILIGILWLIGMTLGTCFWFNIRFGFNLFSAAHWGYLATQQATRQPVSFWFYFSFIVATFVTLFGLHLLIRPRKRNINVQSATHAKVPSAPVPTPQPQEQKPQPNTHLSSAQQTQSAQPIPEATSHIPLSRPPRLNIAPSNTFSAAAPTPVATQMPTQNITSSAQSTTDQNTDKLHEIFSSAGYVIKRAPYINGIKMSTLAIGTNEVLYLVATNIATHQMQSCANKLKQIFSDTLDGVEITVHPIVLQPTDTQTQQSDILTFNTIDTLREYIIQHRNPPLPSDDDGNFDAYSDYISTVIEYIGKL